MKEKSLDTTNGMLEILEQDLLHCQHVMKLILNGGRLSDNAYDTLKDANLKLISAAIHISNARGWNLDDSN